MNGQGKAAQAAGAAGTTAHGAGVQSEPGRDSSIAQESQWRNIILDFIPQRKADAIPRRDLVTFLGLSDRQTRKLVQLAREDGAPILSDVDDHGGYWLADLSTTQGQQEAARFLRQEWHRASMICKRLSSLEKSLKAARTTEGSQVTIEGWGAGAS